MPVGMTATSTQLNRESAEEFIYSCRVSRRYWDVLLEWLDRSSIVSRLEDRHTVRIMCTHQQRRFVNDAIRIIEQTDRAIGGSRGTIDPMDGVQFMAIDPASIADSESRVHVINNDTNWFYRTTR